LKRLLPSARGLLGGTALLLVTLNLANVLHFAFHFVMARLLGPAAYGVLAALIAMLYILNVAAESAQTVVARYASREPAPGRLHGLLRQGLRQGGRATLLLLALYLLAAVPLSRLLHIPYAVMALFAPSLVGVGLLPISRGMLQGTRRFAAFGVNALLEAVVKLGLGALLVWWGWGEGGAAAAVGIALSAAFALSFLSLRDLFRVPAEPAGVEGISRYSLPVFLVTATVMAFYSLDVLLARAFFSPVEAGTYSVASFLAKGILIGTLPIGRAMFPISTEAAERQGDRRKVLAGALGILVACVLPVLAAFAFYPEPLVRLAAGKEYHGAAAIALPLAAAMSLMAVSQTVLLYKLSTGRLRFFKLLPLLVLVEMGVLALFHGSLAEYAAAVLALNGVFLLATAAAAFSSPPRSPAP
jgi:O-antigen/teichoic acid export membrane protein